MKFSCCIEMIFTEFDFIERIYKAKEAGFDCVEFWCWKNKDLAAIKKALDETGMEVAIFQGNLEGRMIDAKDHEIYISGVLESAGTALYLGAKTLFLMSDIMQEDRIEETIQYFNANEDAIQEFEYAETEYTGEDKASIKRIQYQKNGEKYCFRQDFILENGVWKIQGDNVINDFEIKEKFLFWTI